MTGAVDKVEANPLSGEVGVSVGDHTVVFHAPMRALAAFQGACGVVGLGAVEVMLEECDPRAILAGLRHLTVSGDAEAIIETATVADYQPLGLGILEAIKFGLPEPKPEEGTEGGSAKPGKRQSRTRSTGS